MEELTRQVDAYCERLDPSFWAEPVNALTNLAFVLGALYAWMAARRAGRDGDWAVRALCVNLAVIGVGSFLFHTLANRWSAAADVLPILVFILLYLHLATVRYFRLPVWAGLAAAVLFFPFSAAAQAVLQPLVGGLNGSLGYAPTWLVMAGFALVLALRAHPAARGVGAAAALLLISLTARTFDDQTGPVCEAFPLGAHWLWHVLNGTLLTVLIVTLIRHGARNGGTRNGGARDGGTRDGGTQRT